MSGIYGVVRFDGKPALEGFVAVQSAMKPWGTDTTSLVHGAAAMGQALLRTTPEASFEQMPALACGGTVLMTVAARLDGRADLCAALRLEPGRAAVTADGTLVRLAFERWGEDCVHHLLGDWSLAAWNESTRRLFLARDHFGNTALHYRQWPNGFVFASGIEGILALEEVRPELNQHHLAGLLMQWSERDDTTAYREVYRLAPAYTLTLHGTQSSLDRYWKLEQTPALRLRSNAEYVEAFRALFRGAVGDRLRSSRPVASALSGGLDSGAVTALAAEGLRERGQSLRAYTAVPIYDTPKLLQRTLDNEWDLASQTARWIGNIEHLPLPAQGWTPLAGAARTLEILREPSPAIGNGYWVNDLLAELQRGGYGVLLSGQCGNYAASFDGGAFRAWSAWRQGRLPTVLRELASGAKMRRSWMRALLGELVKPAMLSSQYAWRRLTGANNAPFWARDSVVSPVLVHQLGLHQTARERIADHLYLHAPRDQWLQVLPLICGVGATWHSLGAAHGLEVRDPTMDKRLLEFCFAIPQHQFVGDGHQRWLMRRAVQGLLPPAVQWNTRRGLQGADLGFRLLADSDAVQAGLEHMVRSKSCMQYLDVHKVNNAWKRLQQERTNPLQEDGYLVLGGLIWAMFLNAEAVTTIR